MSATLPSPTPVPADLIRRALPTAHLAGPEHYDLLHRATLAEDRELIGRLVVEMVPAVMMRPDRYGWSNDKYRTETEPLLGVLIGAALPDTENYQQLERATFHLDIAIDNTILTTRLIRRELPRPAHDRLDDALQQQATHLRRAARSVRPQASRVRERDDHGIAIFLSGIGRIRAARSLARLDNDDTNLRAATVLAASLRRRWVLDESLRVLDRVLELDPRMAEAITCRIGVLVDRGDHLTAHRLATSNFRQQPSAHAAKALLRTSKATNDTASFEAAERYLHP